MAQVGVGLTTRSIARRVEAAESSEAAHQWYQTIMGFDWRLVQFLIDHLGIRPDHSVLDPFCGAGTTLVQCKKNGIASIGIDVNPVCVLASSVKTKWDLQPERLREKLSTIVDRAGALFGVRDFEKDPAFRYLEDCGMIERGWVSRHKAIKLVALRSAIQEVEMLRAERDFFMLSLISATVKRIADIKFGPEVYCLPKPKRTSTWGSFASQSRLRMTHRLTGSAE